MSKESGLSQAFLGLIVLPIAGNACEHITAVFVACKNKMDLAIGVALGSSIQVRAALGVLQLRWVWSPGLAPEVAMHVMGLFNRPTEGAYAWPR